MQSFHGKPEACFKMKGGTGLVFANDLTTSSFEKDEQADNVNLSETEYFSEKSWYSFTTYFWFRNFNRLKLRWLKLQNYLIPKTS